MFATSLRAGTFVVLVVVCLFGPARQSRAQGEVLTKNSLYLELGGNAVAYSINYDRVLGDAFSARLGISFFNTGEAGSSASLAIIPLTAHYLLGHGSSRLELGGGVSIATASVDFGNLDERGATTFFTGTFAYRYQKPGGGVFFKAGFTPLISGSAFLPWFGLSIGYTL